ncbi:MAG: hypothetical protein AB7O39_08850 [Flavobacteriaceae bacterium]
MRRAGPFRLRRLANGTVGRNIGVLGLSIAAQLSRDVVLILILGFGSALDVVKASTAIQVYLFTTMASAAANHFHGTRGARLGDFFVVYAAFAVLAQYVLFDLVVAPGFTGDKLDDARFYGHVALLLSIVVMPYAVYRHRYLEARRYPYIAGQQLVVSLLYIAGFLILFRFVEGTPAAFFAYCLAVLIYFAIVVGRSGGTALTGGWRSLALSAGGLTAWTAVFAAQAVQSSARFIDRAFASTLGDGYFALVDVIYAILAGLTMLPLGVFSIFMAARFAQRADWQRYLRLAMLAASALALVLSLPLIAGVGLGGSLSLAGVTLSLRDMALAFVAPLAFVSGSIGFHALLSLGDSRAAFAIVFAKIGCKFAYLLALPQMRLFDILVSIVVTEALASLVIVWRSALITGSPRHPGDG